MIIRLYWWKKFDLGNIQNYGDLMSKYLVKKLSGKIVVTTRSKYNKYFKRFIKKYYIVIGSIIGSANKNAIVWGSGIISEDQIVKNAEFLAVRGPRTRKRLLDLGFEVPEIYGDPALLLPDFFENTVDKKYEFGIIPHFIDNEFVLKHLFKHPKIKVINLLTNSVEKTTKEILECEHILSSSLHGVIVGQAYEIPSLWIKFSNKLSGDDVKFYDYFESLHIPVSEPILKHPKDLNLDVLKDIFKTNKLITLADKDILTKVKADLLKSCPF